MKKVQESIKKKHGRPKTPIDLEQLDKLCYLQCTLFEIASWFNCSEDTIERRIKQEFSMLFADYRKQKATGGRIAIRRKQMQIAQTGNVTMLIWLGKQYLGQSDKKELTAPAESRGFTLKYAVDPVEEKKDEKK